MPVYVLDPYCSPPILVVVADTSTEADAVARKYADQVQREVHVVSGSPTKVQPVAPVQATIVDQGTASAMNVLLGPTPTIGQQPVNVLRVTPDGVVDIGGE